MRICALTFYRFYGDSPPRGVSWVGCIDLVSVSRNKTWSIVFAASLYNRLIYENDMARFIDYCKRFGLRWSKY